MATKDLCRHGALGVTGASPQDLAFADLGTEGIEPPLVRVSHTDDIHVGADHEDRFPLRPFDERHNVGSRILETYLLDLFLWGGYEIGSYSQGAEFLLHPLRNRLVLAMGEHAGDADELAEEA